MIQHEGLRPANFLTMLFSVLLYLYLTVWPVAGGLEKGRLGTNLYLFISLSAAYMLSLMAIYLLSAALNLIHWKKRRDGKRPAQGRSRNNIVSCVSGAAPGKTTGTEMCGVWGKDKMVFHIERFDS